jgi:hypothetical protein
MNRIRCIPLLAFIEVPPTRMAESVLRRACGKALLRDLESKVMVARMLELGNVSLRRAMQGGQAPAPLDAATVLSQFGEHPPNPGLIDKALSTLSPDSLRGVLEESVLRVRGRDRLPRRELNVALVPFTEGCVPEAGRGRECWCGSWIIEGEDSCVFCGGAPPGGDGCRLWRRDSQRVVQLEPLLADAREMEEWLEASRDQDISIPPGCDPYEYIAQLEAGGFVEQEVYEHAK